LPGDELKAGKNPCTSEIPVSSARRAAKVGCSRSVSGTGLKASVLEACSVDATTV